MASLYKAQDVVSCELCLKSVEYRCKICQTNLCEECIGKHIASKKQEHHDIVHVNSYDFKKAAIVLPICKIHSDQKCEVHCQKCDSPVCVMCIFEVHNGHTFVKMEELYGIKQRKLQKETSELENIFATEYKKMKSGLESKRLMLTSQYDKLNAEIYSCGEIWHAEIDKIVHQFVSQVEKMRKQDISTLDSLIDEVENLLSLLDTAIKENKKVLKSEDVMELCNYKSKNDMFIETPSTVDIEPPELIPSNFEGLDEKFGILKKSKVKEVPGYIIFMSDEAAPQESNQSDILAILDSGFDEVWRVHCQEDDRAWISNGSKTMRQIDINGSIVQTTNTKSSNKPTDITTDNLNQLVYSDYHDRSVNQVKEETKAILTYGNWKPRGICYTSNNDLLVSMSSNDQQSKIVRYKDLKVQQEFQFDDQGKSLFKKAAFLAENQNGDICVSDWDAKAIVVLEKSGQFRFKYSGKVDQYDFLPRGIATDKLCQILAADKKNHFVHIIDKNGQFLSCINTCNLNVPFDLDIDKLGRLWVGEFGTGKVKVIKYQ